MQNTRLKPASWMLIAALSLLCASGAWASDNTFGGLGYAQKSFSEFSDAEDLDVYFLTYVQVPAAGSDGKISGLGSRAELGYMDGAENSGNTYFEFLGGYEIGRAEQFSFFIGAGFGYHSWSPGDVEGFNLDDDSAFVWVWDVNLVFLLGKSAISVGYRGDENNKVDFGLGEVDLSGDRLYVSLVFDWK